VAACRRRVVFAPSRETSGSGDTRGDAGGDCHHRGTDAFTEQRRRDRQTEKGLQQRQLANRRNGAQSAGPRICAILAEAMAD